METQIGKQMVTLIEKYSVFEMEMHRDKDLLLNIILKINMNMKIIYGHREHIRKQK